MESGKQIGEPVTRDRTLRKGPPPVRIHWRMTRYEKCTIFETLDDNGNPIASQKLDKTNEDTIGQGDKAVGYGGNSDGLIEIPRDPKKKGVWADHDVKKWGHLIILYVTGCKEVTFFQYAHEVLSLTGEADKDLGWSTDPAPPKMQILNPNAFLIRGRLMRVSPLLDSSIFQEPKGTPPLDAAPRIRS